MVDSNHTSRDDLIDALLDLKHDLGKYIRLPVAILPDDATATEVREALHGAIHHTRKGPGDTRSAQQIWASFVGEAGTALGDSSRMRGLTEAVEQAIGLASQDELPPREQLVVRLGAVSERIQLLLEEVSGG